MEQGGKYSGSQGLEESCILLQSFMSFLWTGVLRITPARISATLNSLSEGGQIRVKEVESQE